MVKFRILIFLSAVSLSLCAEDAQPQDVERARKWVADLGAEDYETRETASRELLKMGERAWPVVMNHLDDPVPERRQRIRQLVPQVAAFLPEQHEAARTHLAELENREDEFKRAAGLDGLLAMGPAGERALRAHLSSPEGKPEIRLTVLKRVLTPGETGRAEVKVVNAGKGHLWHDPTHPPSAYLGNHQPFGEERPNGGVFGHRGAGGRRRVVCGAYYNPIRAWVPRKPGDTLSEKSYEDSKHEIGRYTWWASFTSSKSTIKPRCPGTEDTIALEVGFQCGLSTSEEVFVLPNFEKLPETKWVDLELTAAARRVEAGDALNVTAVFRSKAKKPIALENELSRFAWFVVSDENGVPVTHGSWKSALAKDNTITPSLAPAASAECPLKIVMPEKPGRYGILIGYEVKPSDEGVPPPQATPVFSDADREAAAQGKLILVETEQCYAQLQNIVVVPPEPKP